MAKKLRSVNTYFWDDSFIQDLNPTSKLLFLYLLTNSLTNVLGIYEITLKRIVFDTGLNELQIKKAFEAFGSLWKVYYIDNYIILPNFLKNQSMNSNMKTGAINVFNELPQNIRELSDYKEEVKDFETLLKALKGFENSNSNIKFNIKSNSKDIKPKILNPSLDEVKLYFKENGYKEDIATKAFNFYDTANWIDSKGNQVLSWKQKMISVWFKEENKKPVEIKKRYWKVCQTAYNGTDAQLEKAKIEFPNLVIID